MAIDMARPIRAPMPSVKIIVVRPLIPARQPAVVRNAYKRSAPNSKNCTPWLHSRAVVIDV